MNTLNNIHALVDIDPEQAKDSIVDMSRMMRYLLYESDNHCVSLNKAIVFLKKYLNLMKLRYTDMVNVNLDVPESCPEDIAIVPLVFIPFVENAFKHGVSYDKPSTIPSTSILRRKATACCSTATTPRATPSTNMEAWG